MSALRLASITISMLIGAVVLASVLVPRAIQTSSTITIGALLCYSGSCAEWGTAGLHGAQMAVTEVNASGGVLGKQLQIIAEDSREDTPAASVSAYRGLISRADVHYIIGPTWTAAAQALLPVARNYTDIVMISPSVGVRDFNEAAPHLFNLWPHDDVGTTALAEHVFRSGYRRVAITGSQQPWEKLQADTFQKRFTELGGTVVARIDPLPNETNLRSESFTLFRSSPEAVFFGGMIQMGLVARELKQLGYQGPKFAILMDQTRVEEARGGLEETQFAFYPEGRKSFSEKYQHRFGAPPTASAGTAYDAVKLVVRAMQEAGTTEPSRVQQSLLKIADYDGVSGTISMDKFGGVAREPQLLEVHGNSFDPVPWAS